MVRIDRRSGKKVFGAWPSDEPKAAVIWEAFKPESEPRRSIRRDEMANRPPEKAAPRVKVRQAESQRDSDFLQNQGGIY
jgi:penicillin-binding protein 1A